MPHDRIAPPLRWRATRRGVMGALVGVVMVLVASVATAGAPRGEPTVGQAVFDSSFAHGLVSVEGGTLHFVRGGSGSPVVLLHGWPQTWFEWRPVMAALAQNHTVIAFDLPGLGASSIPSSGYDKVTTAKRIREGVRKLGFTGQVAILAHDIGNLVAYPYARDFPTEVSRVAMLELPLSGFGLENFYGVSWHFGFNMTAAPIPETIMDNDDVSAYLGMLFNGTVHPDRIPQQVYFDAYTSAARRAAGYKYYRAFAADAADNQAKAAANRLHMPVMAMGSAVVFGPFVAQSFSQVADDVRGVIAPDAGHWISEENPSFLIDCAGLFFGPAGGVPSRPELANCVA